MKKYIFILAIMFLGLGGRVYADSTINFTATDSMDISNNTVYGFEVIPDDSPIVGYKITSISLKFRSIPANNITIMANQGITTYMACTIDKDTIQTGLNTYPLTTCSTYENIQAGASLFILGFMGENLELRGQQGANTYAYGSFTYNGGGSGGGETETGTTISSMISDASSGIESVSGSSIGSMVSWTADNLIKLFIGSGLMVLLALRYWIIALVVIGIIVYFAYRAFRFYRT